MTCCITARHADEKLSTRKTEGKLLKRNATVLSSTNNKVGFFFLVVRHLDTAAEQVRGRWQVASGAPLHQPPCTALLALPELSN